MFLASSPKPIDPPLKDLADQIEQQSPNLSVLAARQFIYFVEQTPVEVTIAEPRKYNILEEFILRSGVELSPTPNITEVAKVLKLDPIFIKNTVNTLKDLQTLDSKVTEEILLTPEGREFYLQGFVPQPPKTQEIYAIADPLNYTLRFISKPLKSVSTEVSSLEKFVSLETRIQKIDALNLAEIQDLVQTSGLALHIPEEGKRLISAQAKATPNKIYQPLSIFVLFDVLEDKITLQVRKGKNLLPEASEDLKNLQETGEVSLNHLFQLSNETIENERESLLAQRNEEIEARLNSLQQMALTHLQENKETNKDSKIQLLRDRQIRVDFLSTLTSAVSNVLIYSPWVSETVIDKQFLELLENLAKRGVWILIGHGISRREENEDRPIPPEVKEKLKAIKTPEGLSAVQVFWLGNSHAKEVIVDQKVHLCGSHNWLSYRGDWLPRGETVYKVTFPEKVQEAYNFLAGRFQDHAQRLWEEALQTRNLSLITSSLCIWGALGKEEFALQKLQENKILSLLPLWLQVARQGLRSKRLSPKSTCFVTALAWLSKVQETYPKIESLREEWRNVIGAISSQNRELALELLNNETWSNFTRLGITQAGIDNPSEFISQYVVKPPKKVAKTKKRKRAK